MIRRFYVHNYRCLENFELPISGQSSVLLIGKSGSGKTTLGLALLVLRRIARGTNRIGKLVTPNNLTRGRKDVPVRFEILAELEGKLYEYVIALELPENFKELRIQEEKLAVDGVPVYTRNQAQVHLLRAGQEHRREATFRVDWHLVALPIIQELSHTDPLSIFKRWLARMLILRPTPSLINGDSDYETPVPLTSVKNFGAWFSHLLSDSPATYAKIDQYLKQVMPDLRNIKNPLIGTDSRSLEVEFAQAQESLRIPFKNLADGEKCLMICALVLAARQAYGPTVCFWDEPDNYLAPDEVGHAVLALRQAFDSGGQFIATSHNPEAIRRFSDENTFVLHRRSHLEPVIVRPLRDLQVNGDLAGALIRGDLVP